MHFPQAVPPGTRPRLVARAVGFDLILIVMFPERNEGLFLIVTPNLTIQDLYVLLLRAQRLPAVGVSTCEEALRLAALTQLTAVLFDIADREDWSSLVQLCRALPRGTPIVALSGWHVRDRTERELARGLGCCGFIAKPATAGLVLQALRRAAEGSPWSEYLDSSS